MQAVDDLHAILGELVKRQRALTMQQRDFALRVGCSQRTLTRLEQGQPVNSETLFNALAVLGLLDDFTALAENKLRAVKHLPERKRQSDSESFNESFNNDF
ncbi:helix-turn-helix domain-containing protein [Pseudidiomarina donghaiensis]|uniref:helix-turn-helix domain-containing protein n=1 Tax=Pseudidiomarina donghaiensis TaxID=519452 RepID=UPI003A985E92